MYASCATAAVPRAHCTTGPLCLATLSLYPRRLKYPLFNTAMTCNTNQCPNCGDYKRREGGGVESMIIIKPSVSECNYSIIFVRLKYMIYNEEIGVRCTKYMYIY